MPTVKFVNEKITVEVEEGANLRAVAQKNGIEVYEGPHKIIHCPGFGLCGSCNVAVTKGSENCSPKGLIETGQKFANPLLGLKILSNPDKEVRLSCQTRVEGDMEVETCPTINWHGEKFWN